VRGGDRIVRHRAAGTHRAVGRDGAGIYSDRVNARFREQAHTLSPSDPFIVDSLGWVLYRLGRFGEASGFLNQAYASRKDTEIAAHLGESLWAEGKRDEAVQVLRDAHRRDAANEVLKQTMARLKVAP